MNEVLCPNCGRHLVDYRTDRQQAGRREVVLHWLICVGCRHVALQQWKFVDTPHQDYLVREERPMPVNTNKPVRRLRRLQPRTSM